MSWFRSNDVENLYLLGNEAGKELLRQDMATKQRSTPPIINKNKPDPFESAQMDPFVAVTLEHHPIFVCQ